MEQIVLILKAHYCGFKATRRAFDHVPSFNPLALLVLVDELKQAGHSAGVGPDGGFDRLVLALGIKEGLVRHKVRVREDLALLEAEGSRHVPLLHFPFNHQALVLVVLGLFLFWEGILFGLSGWTSTDGQFGQLIYPVPERDKLSHFLFELELVLLIGLELPQLLPP